MRRLVGHPGIVNLLRIELMMSVDMRRGHHDEQLAHGLRIGGEVVDGWNGRAGGAWEVREGKGSDVVP